MSPTKPRKPTPRQEATSPDTTAERLKELAADPKLARLVAANPSAPAELLLSCVSPEAVLYCCLLSDPPEPWRKLARDDTLPAKTFALAPKNEEPYSCIATTRNRQTTADDVIHLVINKDSERPCAIDKNIHVFIAASIQLAMNEYSDVRHGVAGNCKTPNGTVASPRRLLGSDKTLSYCSAFVLESRRIRAPPIDINY